MGAHRVDSFESGGRNLVGNELAEAPEWTAGFGMRYQPEEGLTASADLGHTDERFTSPANTTVLDAYTLVNGRIGWQFPRIGVFLFGQNLSARVEECMYSSSVGGVELVEIGDPRTVGVLVDLRR